MLSCAVLVESTTQRDPHDYCLVFVKQIQAKLNIYERSFCMKQATLLWIDNISNPPKALASRFNEIYIARTYKEATKILATFNYTSRDVLVSFDSSLGYSKKHGIDIAKFIVRHHIPIRGFQLHGEEETKGSQVISRLLVGKKYKRYY